MTPSDDAVLPATAADDVIPAAPTDRVTTAETHDHVPTGRTKQDVRAVSTDDRRAQTRTTWHSRIDAYGRNQYSHQRDCGEHVTLRIVPTSYGEVLPTDGESRRWPTRSLPSLFLRRPWVASTPRAT